MEYYWIKPEVAGDLGMETDYDPRREPALVGPLHYSFTSWSEDDMVSAFGYWIVTERLANALASSSLTGWSLDKVVISIDDVLQHTSPPEPLPPWHRLVSTGVACRDDFGIRSNVRLAISERVLDLLRKFELNHAQLHSVSEYPDGPPRSKIMTEFWQRMKEKQQD